MNVIELIHLNQTNKSSIGVVFLNGEFQMFSIEDPQRDTKIPKITGIPDGVYPVGLREAESDMTIHYRNKYPWFKYHIWVKEVPDFEWVYFHIGNWVKNSDGCVLSGDGVMSNIPDEGKTINSTDAFKRFYQKLYPLLEAGEETILIVKTIDLVGALC